MTNDPVSAEEISRFVDQCVGENLDQLIAMDMRGDSISRVLMAAARKKMGAPLALKAARELQKLLAPKDRVLMLTGFIVPPWDVGETDGLIGTVVLGRALEVALGARPVVVCESQVLPPLAAGFRTAGLQVFCSLDAAGSLPHSVVLLPFPKDKAEAAAEATRLANLIQPRACVAIERPGGNIKGEYHTALGTNVTPWIAPVDFLYDEVVRNGVRTVAIGDFGNELGMGTISETVLAETPAGAQCGCPCASGVACLRTSDVTVACSVSDWGAYAVAAALSYLKQDPFVFMPGEFYKRVLEATVVGGCIDGTSNYSIPHIDGVREDFNVRMVEMLADVVAYAGRKEKFRPIREYRIRRQPPLEI